METGIASVVNCPTCGMVPEGKIFNGSIYETDLESMETVEVTYKFCLICRTEFNTERKPSDYQNHLNSKL